MPFPSKVRISGQPSGARLDHPLQVKRLHMRGAAAGQLLYLPFPDRHAGRAGDRGARRLHRAARGLDRGELAEPVGVLLLRQVQHRVQRVHVAPARRPVGDPRHRDLPELRHQRPFRPFSARVRGDPVLPGHVMPPVLAGGRQVQPALEQPPQQLPAPHAPAVLPAQRAAAPPPPRRHPVLQLREALPGLRERLVPARRVPLHRAPSFAIRSSDNQDRNEKEPFKHAPTRANRTQRQRTTLKLFTLHHPRRAAPDSVSGRSRGTVTGDNESRCAEPSDP